MCYGDYVRTPSETPFIDEAPVSRADLQPALCRFTWNCCLRAGGSLGSGEWRGEQIAPIWTKSVDRVHL